MYLSQPAIHLLRFCCMGFQTIKSPQTAVRWTTNETITISNVWWVNWGNCFLPLLISITLKRFNVLFPFLWNLVNQSFLNVKRKSSLLYSLCHENKLYIRLNYKYLSSRFILNMKHLGHRTEMHFSFLKISMHESSLPHFN